MNMRTLLFAAALAALLPGAAQAACTHQPYDFHPEKNDGVVVNVVAQAGESCVHDFTDPKGYTLRSITFERMPAHGKITEEGKDRWVYTPAKDYRGRDFYIFEVCGSKGAEKGCSALAFNVTVKAP
jgi:Bacterial Ig domain